MEVHQREEKEHSSSLKRREEGQCLQRETSRGYEGQKEKQNLLEECNHFVLHRLYMRVPWYVFVHAKKNLPRGRFIASFPGTASDDGTKAWEQG